MTMNPSIQTTNGSYRDYFHESAQSVAMSLPRPKKRGPRGGVVVPFPVKLHSMLSAVGDDNLQNLVSWEPHGRSFTIFNPERFETEVVSRFFNQTKFSSFRRQLNLYGFRQALLSPMDNGMTYYHQLFLRGRPDLAKCMQRTGAVSRSAVCASNKATRKASGSTKSSSSESKPMQEEPDFSQMPICSDNTKVEEAQLAASPIIRHESNIEKQKDLLCERSTPLLSITKDTFMNASQDTQVVSATIVSPTTVTSLVDTYDLELPHLFTQKAQHLGVEESSDLLRAPRILSPTCFSNVFEHLLCEPDSAKETEDSDPLKFLSEYFGPEPLL